MTVSVVVPVGSWSRSLQVAATWTFAVTPGTGGTVRVQWSTDNLTDWREVLGSPFSTSVSTEVPNSALFIRATAAVTAGSISTTPVSAEATPLTPLEIATVRTDINTRKLVANTWVSSKVRTDGQFADLPYTPKLRVQINPRTNQWNEVMSGTVLTRTGTAVYAAHPAFNTRKSETYDGAAVHYVTLPRSLILSLMGGSIDGPLTIFLAHRPNFTRANNTAEPRYIFQWADSGTSRGIYAQGSYHFSGSAPYANTNTVLFGIAQDFAASSQLVIHGQTDMTNALLWTNAVTLDGTVFNRNYRAYTNGAMEDAGISTYYTITPQTADMVICIRNTLVGTTSWKGDFVEMIIFDKCLTPTEVAQVHNALIGTGVRRTMFFDDGDTDPESLDAIKLQAAMSYSGSWDLRAVVLDGIGIHAAPAWRCFLNELNLDFVPIYQNQGSIEVAYTAAPNDWATVVTTAWRTPGAEDRTATSNATSLINLTNVNYPNILAGIKTELAACPDGSVTAVFGGFANTFILVLQDPAGLALVSAKFADMYLSMGWWYKATAQAGYIPGQPDGITNGTADYNTNRDQTNWQLIFNLLPSSVKVRITPTEIGYQALATFNAGRLISASSIAKALAVFNGYLGTNDTAAAPFVATLRQIWDLLPTVAAVDDQAIFSDATGVSGRITIALALSKLAGIGGWTAVDVSQTGYNQTWLVLDPAKLNTPAIVSWVQGMNTTWST